MASYLWEGVSWVANTAAGVLGLSQQPKPQLELRVKIVGDVVLISNPGVNGVTAAELEAQVVSIARDGNCLYTSICTFLKDHWKTFRGRKVFDGITLEKLPSPSDIRGWIASYIESQFPSLLTPAVGEESLDEHSLIMHLNESIEDCNRQALVSAQEQMDSIQGMIAQQRALQLTASDVKKLQENYEKAQAQAFSDQYEKGAAGYTKYTKRIREDMRFHGGYAEVYALAQLLGITIKVLAASTQAQLESGEEATRVALFIAKPEGGFKLPIMCYLLFSPDQRHFDLLRYTGEDS